MNFSAGHYFRAAKGGEFDRRVGIYVEGVDDAHFIDHILRQIGAQEDQVRLIFTGGINEMDRDLIGMTKSRAYVTRSVDTIAVFRDCDADPTAAVAAANQALRSAGLPGLQHAEVVEYDEGRKIGLFVIPSNDLPGAVEELMLSTVDGEEKFDMLRSTYENVEREFGVLNKRGKRLAQIYLASCEPLVKGAGLGFKNGHFPVEHPNFDPIREFLQRIIATP